ncbi:MAG: hypothetical protein U0527_10125 [Candidatus Eisenbacteria bacterium]
MSAGTALATDIATIGKSRSAITTLRGRPRSRATSGRSTAGAKRTATRWSSAAIRRIRIGNAAGSSPRAANQAATTAAVIATNTSGYDST